MDMSSTKHQYSRCSGESNFCCITRWFVLYSTTIILSWQNCHILCMNLVLNPDFNKTASSVSMFQQQLLLGDSYGCQPDKYCHGNLELLYTILLCVPARRLFHHVFNCWNILLNFQGGGEGSVRDGERKEGWPLSEPLIHLLLRY